MLYDTTADVIRKALRGLAMAPSEAAARSGLAERAVMAASRGPAAPEILDALAPALGLHRRALAGLPCYRPPACPLAEVRRLELPFDDETVNAWLVAAGAGEHLLFDAGDGPSDAARTLDRIGVAGVHGLVTHGHGDHVGGLAGLGGRLRSLAGPGFGSGMEPGREVRIGRLTVRAIDLPGHCPGALGYLIEGLARPICVTGDALFAGSIGGCGPGEPYRAALAALRTKVMTLPQETILLPGHGPETTVGAEEAGNPFLAG